ncbi:MAG: hypothetical protein IPP58_05930 [Holophagaceae bacterium]|uniref:Uncharacterized protein n=1 Tax=Candidatus Geothrix skivensis TaxID=2954439 RepID=A0A9D7XKZ7_9BACT|nr:hypothetical protein [Candidatus Geothrix skivensis]
MARSSLRWIIPTFLALQLGLLWIQGAQVHRQNQVLQALREDVQALAESIAAGQSSFPQEGEGSTVPLGRRPQAGTLQKVAVLGLEEDQDPVAKELKAGRESAQKAVQEAREVKSKLSIEENVRKAEETKKLQSATTAWQGWIWGAMALVALALGARAVIRRRA